MSRVRRSSRRLPFPDLPARKDRRMQWGIAITITMLLAAGYATYLSARRASLPEPREVDQETKPVKTPAETAPSASNPSPAEMPALAPALETASKASEPPSPDPRSSTAMDRFRKAETVMREFMATRRPGDIHPLIRHGDDVIQKAIEWHRTRPAMDGPVKLGPQFGVMENFIVTQVTLADGSQRMAVFEEQDGAMRLDWESFVGYGEAAFDDLDALPADRNVLIRASVTQEVTMSDSELLRFRLEHPSETRAMSVIARREELNATPGGKRLASSGRGYYTLRLATAKQEKDSPPSVRITRVESYGWVPELAAREMVAR